MLVQYCLQVEWLREFLGDVDSLPVQVTCMLLAEYNHVQALPPCICLGCWQDLTGCSELNLFRSGRFLLWLGLRPLGSSTRGLEDLLRAKALLLVSRDAATTFPSVSSCVLPYHVILIRAVISICAQAQLGKLVLQVLGTADIVFYSSQRWLQRLPQAVRQAGSPSAQCSLFWHTCDSKRRTGFPERGGKAFGSASKASHIAVLANSAARVRPWVLAQKLHALYWLPCASVKAHAADRMITWSILFT